MLFPVQQPVDCSLEGLGRRKPPLSPQQNARLPGKDAQSPRRAESLLPMAACPPDLATQPQPNQSLLPGTSDAAEQEAPGRAPMAPAGGLAAYLCLPALLLLEKVQCL